MNAQHLDRVNNNDPQWLAGAARGGAPALLKQPGVSRGFGACAPQSRACGCILHVQPPSPLTQRRKRLTRSPSSTASSSKMVEDESRPASAAVDKEALKEALAEILAEMPAFKAISAMNDEKEAGSSSKATAEAPNAEASTSG